MCVCVRARALRQVLPNRNSLAYEQLYGIAGAPTVFRGTLRYAGFSEAILGLRRAGLLRDIQARRADGSPAATWGEVERLAPLGPAAAAAAAHLGLDGETPLADPASLLGSLCHAMEERLRFQPGERDMVLMRHEVRAAMPDGTVEAVTSSLRVLGGGGGTGPAGDTAMGRTVGLTAGVCARLVLDGRLAGQSGVVTPVIEDVYGPALALLSQEGIRFDERSEVVPPGH